MRRRCPAITRAGDQCSGPVAPGGTWCFNHDPARESERRRNASRAGRSRSGAGEIVAIKTRLDALHAGVLDGSIDPKIGAVANQIVNTTLRAVEVERRLRELGEIEAKIRKLEDRADAL